MAFKCGYLSVSTYDGSGQVVHPDVLWDDDKQEFWMGITPYPDFQDSFENPCLYYSNDGMSFVANAISNPLAPKPIQGFNCDPDIFFDWNGQKKMIYVETVTPKFQIVHLLNIQNDFSVKRDTLWHHEWDSLSNENEFVLSPSIVPFQQQYWMYYVNLVKDASKPNEIKLGKLSELNKAQLSNFHNLNIDLPIDYNPWHIDVFHTGKRFVMLLNGFYGAKYENNGGSLTGEYSIQLLTSKDGLVWKNHGDIIGSGNPQSQAICSNLDSYFRYVFRGSGVYSEKLNKLVVWFSYVSTDNVWKLAVHKFDIDLDK